MLQRLKVLLVGDDAIHKIDISEAINCTGIGKVVHSSSNGNLALEWLMHSEANVVVLDAIIDGQSSIDILKSIKSQYNYMEVIMINDETPRSMEITLEGLKCGAFDFIQKKSDFGSLSNAAMNQLMVLFTQIIIKQTHLSNNQADFAGIEIKNSTVMEEKPERETKSTITRVNKFNPLLWDKAELILIAASTGGPAALQVLCKMFPEDFARPILIVQHMPAKFTRALAESLDRKCALSVEEARDGEIIEKEKILIAAGGIHSIVEKKGHDNIIRLKSGSPVNGVRPAADVLFKSCAQSYAGKNVLVVILTGMGNDGLEGLRAIKNNCNCYCMVQSEKTCVVYGMPRCVHEAGLADEVVDLHKIGARLCEFALGRR